ncbi:hypothetical protein CAEBREN_22593 [Caenorhabditis brenneri]|uniref:Uncharacterized protein n=1 Tax=Caenorhabditis brenneri TaxID=135651 RepID=G0N6U1_CAEBE|nr:hypothetical protein CAEBREN_22593 [Caenorhabditis brenneri]
MDPHQPGAIPPMSRAQIDELLARLREQELLNPPEPPQGQGALLAYYQQLNRRLELALQIRIEQLLRPNRPIENMENLVLRGLNQLALQFQARQPLNLAFQLPNQFNAGQVPVNAAIPFLNRLFLPPAPPPLAPLAPPPPPQNPQLQQGHYAPILRRLIEQDEPAPERRELRGLEADDLFLRRRNDGPRLSPQPQQDRHDPMLRRLLQQGVQAPGRREEANDEPQIKRARPASQNQNPAPQNLNPAPQNLNPAPQNLNPVPQNLNPAPQNLNPAPQTLEDRLCQVLGMALQIVGPPVLNPNLAPQFLNPAPQNLDPAPQNQNPAPQNLNPANQNLDPAPQNLDVAHQLLYMALQIVGPPQIPADQYPPVEKRIKDFQTLIIQYEYFKRSSPEAVLDNFKKIQYFFQDKEKTNQLPALHNIAVLQPLGPSDAAEGPSDAAEGPSDAAEGSSRVVKAARADEVDSDSDSDDDELEDNLSYPMGHRGIRLVKHMYGQLALMDVESRFPIRETSPFDIQELIDFLPIQSIIDVPLHRQAVGDVPHIIVGHSYRRITLYIDALNKRYLPVFEYWNTDGGCLFIHNDTVRFVKGTKYQTLAAKHLLWILRNQCTSSPVNIIKYSHSPYNRVDPPTWPFRSFLRKIGKALENETKIVNLELEVPKYKGEPEEGAKLLELILPRFRVLWKAELTTWDDTELLAAKGLRIDDPFIRSGFSWW